MVSTELILKGKTMYLGFSYSKDILKRFSGLFFYVEHKFWNCEECSNRCRFLFSPHKTPLIQSWWWWCFFFFLSFSVCIRFIFAKPKNSSVYTKNYFYCFKLRFWSFFFMHRIALDSFWGMVFNVSWHHVLLYSRLKCEKKRNLGNAFWFF